MKHILYVALMLALNACSNTSSQQLNHNQKDSIPEVGAWAQASINHYLESHIGNWNLAEDIPEAYMQAPEVRNHRNYCVVKIGYDSKDRFVTNQIIYIDSITKAVFEYDNLNDSLIPWPQQASKDNDGNEIPSSGTYHFDVAFAEWQGKSMGEKVKLVINNKSIKVIYEGGGNLSNTKKGDVIAEGKIMKHKTGVWIIGRQPSDAQLDEIGGCTDGPPIIDFKEKKFWMC